MEQIRQRIACKAIIQYRSKVLILREAATYVDGTNIGKYQLPGGRVEPGEPFADGLAREVLEETGLHVAQGKPVSVGEWFPVIRGEHNQIVAIFFVCTSNSGRVRLSSEHDEHAWVDLASYQQYNIVPPEDKVLGEFFRQQ